jgi:hypothetical protein
MSEEKPFEVPPGTYAGDRRHEGQIREVLQELGIPADQMKLHMDIVQAQFAYLANVVYIGTLESVKLPKLGTFYANMSRVKKQHHFYATIHARELYTQDRSRSPRSAGIQRSMDEGQGQEEGAGI